MLLESNAKQSCTHNIPFIKASEAREWLAAFQSTLMPQQNNCGRSCLTALPALVLLV